SCESAAEVIMCIACAAAWRAEACIRARTQPIDDTGIQGRASDEAPIFRRGKCNGSHVSQGRLSTAVVPGLFIDSRAEGVRNACRETEHVVQLIGQQRASMGGWFNGITIGPAVVGVAAGI